MILNSKITELGDSTEYMIALNQTYQPPEVMQKATSFQQMKSLENQLEIMGFNQVKSRIDNQDISVFVRMKIPGQDYLRCETFYRIDRIDGQPKEPKYNLEGLANEVKAFAPILQTFTHGPQGL